MKLENLNSGLFYVTQPCCYWEFQEYLYDLEAREMEDVEEQANEEIVLPGGIVVKRKDLPPDHPEYVEVKEVNLDWSKAKELISKAWLQTLEEWIKDRYYTEKRENKIKLTFKNVDSPREYNFAGDVCVFDLDVPKAELNRIIKTVLVDRRDGFDVYVRQAFTSYDGFLSFMPNYIERYDEYWQDFKDGRDIKEFQIYKLFWACLNYWLFGIEGSESNMKKRWGRNQDEFQDNLWTTVTNYKGNGKFNDIMEYTPIEAEKEAV